MAITHKKEGDFEYVYLKDVVVYYASVHEPKEKLEPPKKGVGNQSTHEYSLQVFFDKEDRDALESEEININKQIFEVGVEKNKKRKIKYPLTKDDGTEMYAGVDGLHGMQLTLNSHSRAGKPNVLPVLQKVKENGKWVTKEVKEKLGNGTRVNIKCYGYRNRDDQLNLALDVILVLELVPYTGGTGGSAGAIDDDELGITYSKLTKEEERNERHASEFDDDDDDISY